MGVVEIRRVGDLKRVLQKQGGWVILKGCCRNKEGGCSEMGVLDIRRVYDL